MFLYQNINEKSLFFTTILPSPVHAAHAAFKCNYITGNMQNKHRQRLPFKKKIKIHNLNAQKERSRHREEGRKGETGRPRETNIHK